jgi:hypothetical protein
MLKCMGYRFERELAKEGVVFRIRDLGRIEDVVGTIGALDLLEQAVTCSWADMAMRK